MDIEGLIRSLLSSSNQQPTNLPLKQFIWGTAQFNKGDRQIRNTMQCDMEYKRGFIQSAVGEQMEMIKSNHDNPVTTMVLLGSQCYTPIISFVHLPFFSVQATSLPALPYNS